MLKVTGWFWVPNYRVFLPQTKVPPSAIIDITMWLLGDVGTLCLFLASCLLGGIPFWQLFPPLPYTPESRESSILLGGPETLNTDVETSEFSLWNNLFSCRSLLGGLLDLSCLLETSSAWSMDLYFDSLGAAQQMMWASFLIFQKWTGLWVIGLWTGLMIQKGWDRIGGFFFCKVW